LAKIAEKPCKERVITQEMRQVAFDNKQTTDDHGMHIFGIAKDQNGKKFYMVKNSWGETGAYKGIWYVSEAYATYKTMDIMVHKNAIPTTIKQKLNIK
jgi:aminopeptidase C